MKPPRVTGMDLFEVYEENDNLLFVGSTLDGAGLEATDVVYRRPWATAAPAMVRTSSGQYVEADNGE